MIEGAVDGCLSTKLVWEPTFDDFSRESDGLVEMVKECDEHLAALELAVSHITDVANRPDPRLAAPIDPDIYQYYASWKALVESLEN